ncbi:hypothetical protein PLCT2_01008 [Planctomycetaceae bacterium]|nr:hypothetical protein PLCT2_01008 [Planctomycetaceae bacterium]
MAKNYTLTASMREAFKTNFSVRSHKLVADEPLETGGQDAGPLPFELLMAALAGCTTFTLRAYANHKKISLDGVDVEISLSRRDPSEVPPNGKTVVVKKKLKFSDKVPVDLRAKLLEIAGKCPVNKALLEGCEISGELG